LWEDGILRAGWYRRWTVCLQKSRRVINPPQVANLPYRCAVVRQHRLRRAQTLQRIVDQRIDQHRSFHHAYAAW